MTGIPGGFCGITPPGTRTVLGPTVRRPPTSLDIPRSSSVHFSRPIKVVCRTIASADVMAITKWSISDSEKCPNWVGACRGICGVECGCRLWRARRFGSVSLRASCFGSPSLLRRALGLGTLQLSCRSMAWTNHLGGLWARIHIREVQRRSPPRIVRITDRLASCPVSQFIPKAMVSKINTKPMRMRTKV